ncbi:ParA family protein (plasmid) [Borrelia coriaceae]|uniref:ATPase, para family protein n=1 Tax=Borrelia coriaceae ATCC 43381 TaxID=1408429 RepID=W5SW05_9SPIR|nr:ParA family protein [Borrelia coriaceae]AHH11354.1 ATPase, para family protein [Borrelia coriaceae ATCC 43381]UPA17520.1 ParA family protein [Borrelia coriaceae]
MDNKKTKIITIASIKGGVGKSTTCLIFATLLAKDYKVLLIDMDTQASVTSYFFMEIEKQNIDLRTVNIYEVLKNNLGICDAIINIEGNLDLIPSYLSLHKFNKEAITFKEIKLQKQLQNLALDYDYIILDTNPSLDYTLTNALVVSNYIIVPMTAEKWSVESLELLNFSVDDLAIEIPVFLIITRFKKNNTHKELFNLLKEDKNFLGLVSEREDLNKKIAKNDSFNLNKDYILEYKIILNNLLKRILMSS